MINIWPHLKFSPSFPGCVGLAAALQSDFRNSNLSFVRLRWEKIADKLVTK